MMRSTKSWIPEALCVAALAVLGTAIAAQAPTGSLSGVVTDMAGGVIPGCTIVVSSDSVSRTTTTSASGRYRLDGLAPGEYKVEAKIAGFKTESMAALAVQAGRETTWSPSIQIAPGRDLSPGSPDSVESYVARVTGPNAIDCGSGKGLRDEAAQRASLECALAASRDRKPFSTVMKYGGVDSQLAQGLAGTPVGVIFLFRYDSAPCGGPGCAPRFTVRQCETAPVITLDRGISFGSSRWFSFTCGTTDR